MAAAATAHMSTWIAELSAQQNHASPPGPYLTTAHHTGAKVVAWWYTACSTAHARFAGCKPHCQAHAHSARCGRAHIHACASLTRLQAVLLRQQVCSGSIISMDSKLASSDSAICAPARCTRGRQKVRHSPGPFDTQALAFTQMNAQPAMVW